MSIKSLFDYSVRSYRNKDSVGAEHCKSKLENYAAIVVAMAVAVSENEELGTTNSAQHSASVVPNHNSLSNTLSDLLRALETWVLKLSEVVEASPPGTLSNVPSMLPSTGGRPAFNIAKVQIEQLRDTGMNRKAIAAFLGISEKTLLRRRTEYGIQPNFSDISDIDLDKQVLEILQLTPYSGESYVRGSLKGRQKIHVQRTRIRESLCRVDPVGRSIRKRYAICRRVYNVQCPNHLWHD